MSYLMADNQHKWGEEGPKFERIRIHISDLDLGRVPSIAECSSPVVAVGKYLCGCATATVYGKGVYFAKKSKYCSQDTYTPKDNDGNKLMYLCRVLTGDHVQGKTSMVEPPEREKGVRYHSVVDDARNPTIFVIFKDAQAYPDYLVKFHEKVDDV